MPASKSSLTAMYDNGADMCLVDRPAAPPIRVTLDRLRHCPGEITESSYKKAKKCRVRKK